MVDLIIPDARILKANPAKFVVTKKDLVSNSKLIEGLQSTIEKALTELLKQVDRSARYQKFSDFARFRFQTILAIQN